MKRTPAGLSEPIDLGPCVTHWLLELFTPFDGGNSLGWYVETLDESGLACTTTQDPWAAKSFTKEEAEAIAPRLLNKVGAWRAIEHGFYGG